MKAIQTVGLSKRYGRVTALSDVSLTVDAGQIFGLLGPNGAGKSTLLGILAGLVRATAGVARVLGRPYDDPEARRQVGYVPELFRSAPWLTAAETLRFHADFLRYPLSEREQAETLDRVGLGGVAHRRVASFSKGMEQRLAWAVALIGRPALLLLDEPTSALDPGGRHEMAELMRALRDGGVTVFLNSHLLGELEGLADTVALIHRGCLKETGAVLGMLEAGTPRYRIAVGPLSDPVRAWLEARGAMVIPGPDGAVLEVSLARSDLPAFHRALVQQGVAVYEVAPVRRTLEDWFLGEVGAL